MTKTYYHATKFENLSSILGRGILRGYDKVVYLCEKPEEACRFLAIRGISPILVCQVQLEEELVSESFDHNENFFKCKAYTYPDDISVDDISDYLRYELP